MISYAIDIVGLTKRFRRQTQKRGSYTTLKSALLQAFGLLARPSPAHEEHFTYAVRDLTLRIPQGSSVGIIGRNGSGKSTLLKLISGIYRPDTGSVSVNGRVAALIELGAGFHPDFTGRENVILGGVMHGLTRPEIEARLPQIVEFAELADVIDDPVRTYSSGMFMRLGFSLAVHTDPDVLIVDEVLAVGDAAFVQKCKDKVSELKAAGKTLLLVTHDLDAVERWCDEALWLHAGEVKDRGSPRRVIDHYREFLERGEEAALSAQAEKHTEDAVQPDAVKPERWGSREVEISRVLLRNQRGEDHLLFHPHDDLVVTVGYEIRDQVHVKLDELVFGVCITRADGIVMHGTNTEIDKVTLPLDPVRGEIHYHISRLGLLEGRYRLDVAVHRPDGYPYDYHQGAVTFAVRWSEKQVGVYLPASRWLVHEARGAANER